MQGYEIFVLKWQNIKNSSLSLTDDGLSKGKRRLQLNKPKSQSKVTIDDIEYNVSDLSENAKAQLTNIQFVDAKIQQLNNEWAVADTARIGYTAALKAELENIESE